MGMIIHATRRTLLRWGDSVRNWRHARRLGKITAGAPPAYRQYLDEQLQRTLSKKEAALPGRDREFIDHLAALADLSNCAVLCVGCRNRQEIDYMRSKGARSVTGIDLYSRDPDIQVMDMHAMTFGDAVFDVVYSSHSLEHALRPDQAAREFLRVLKPGGLVAVEVPTRYQVRGSDLHDFGSAENIVALFGGPRVQIVWSGQTEPDSERQDAGTRNLRVVMRKTSREAL